MEGQKVGWGELEVYGFVSCFVVDFVLLEIVGCLLCVVGYVF